MKHGWIAIALVLAACNPPPSDDPPLRRDPIHLVVHGPDARPDAAPRPSAARGLLVYTVGADQLGLVDPDTGAITAVTVPTTDGIVVGPHVIAGGVGLPRSWSLDLRAPTLTVARGEMIEAIDADDRLIARCPDGSGGDYTLCLRERADEDGVYVHGRPRLPAPEVVIGAARDMAYVAARVDGVDQHPSWISLRDGVRGEMVGLVADGPGVGWAFGRAGGLQVSCGGGTIAFTQPDRGGTTELAIATTFACPCAISADEGTVVCTLYDTPNYKGIEPYRWTIAFMLGTPVLTPYRWATVGPQRGAPVIAPDGGEWAAMVERQIVARRVLPDGTRTIADVDEAAILYGWTDPLP